MRVATRSMATAIRLFRLEDSSRASGCRESLGWSAIVLNEITKDPRFRRCFVPERNEKEKKVEEKEEEKKEEEEEEEKEEDEEEEKKKERVDGETRGGDGYDAARDTILPSCRARDIFFPI
ncbi:hypothetical protein HZH68_003025 [Vespula germanica]|uniref:Uncharacterized protein n=1 Tax=Vespula germanica TaxID=30212 RepID=A0A834U294_VESGE|nr:hypothetical protein HZH68_003025 [Vespula germanica]